uniref:Uncharacterized protein n=1 Tax=Arundo donax TaxID=35708 RepID=A0A0A8YYU2_ARUDO
MSGLCVGRMCSERRADGWMCWRGW